MFVIIPPSLHVDTYLSSHRFLEQRMSSIRIGAEGVLGGQAHPLLDCGQLGAPLALAPQSLNRPCWTTALVPFATRPNKGGRPVSFFAGDRRSGCLASWPQGDAADSTGPEVFSRMLNPLPPVTAIFIA